MANNSEGFSRLFLKWLKVCKDLFENPISCILHLLCRSDLKKQVIFVATATVILLFKANQPFYLLIQSQCQENKPYNQSN